MSEAIGDQFNLKNISLGNYIFIHPNGVLKKEGLHLFLCYDS